MRPFTAPGTRRGTIGEEPLARVTHGRADAAIEEVVRGLRSQPATLPSKYFYDERGCALFEAITRLPEYYLTRAELGLLDRVMPAWAEQLGPADVAEIGSGSGAKMQIVLRAARRAGHLRTVTLLDISARSLAAAQRGIEAAFPGVMVRTVVGDFATDLGRLGRRSPRLLLFLGSTIGNLEPPAASALLRAAAGVLSAGDAFVVGFDLVKDVEVLERAYDDRAGVTAAFNLNILSSVNARCGTDFDLTAFGHRAWFDAERSRIEMHLVASRATSVRVPGAGVVRHWRQGDHIRTEISCKYSRESVERLLPGTGLRLAEWVTDGLFALALLRPAY